MSLHRGFYITAGTTVFAVNLGPHTEVQFTAIEIRFLLTTFEGTGKFQFSALPLIKCVYLSYLKEALDIVLFDSLTQVTLNKHIVYACQNDPGKTEETATQMLFSRLLFFVNILPYTVIF